MDKGTDCVLKHEQDFPTWEVWVVIYVSCPFNNVKHGTLDENVMSAEDNRIAKIASSSSVLRNVLHTTPKGN